MNKKYTIKILEHHNNNNNTILQNIAYFYFADI